MQTIFEKIIKGEISSYKIAEDEYVYAFMDIMPLRRGHVLVVPKMAVDKWSDLSEDILCRLISMSKTIAQAIERVVPCNRVGMSIIGLEVPHAHIHLIPINDANDLNFTQPKMSISHEELKEISEKIVKALK